MIIKYFPRQFLYYIGVAALPPKDKAGSSPTEWFIQLEKRDYLQAQLFSSNHKPSADVIQNGQLLTSPWSAPSVLRF